MQVYVAVHSDSAGCVPVPMRFRPARIAPFLPHSARVDCTNINLGANVTAHHSGAHKGPDGRATSTTRHGPSRHSSVIGDRQAESARLCFCHLENRRRHE